MENAHERSFDQETFKSVGNEGAKQAHGRHNGFGRVSLPVRQTLSMVVALVEKEPDGRLPLSITRADTTQLSSSPTPIAVSMDHFTGL